MKILMVCLGNICRSPLAQGILEEKIRQQGLDWEVDSAGTGSWHVGSPPDPRSQEVAKKNGLNISKQRARKFRPYDLEEFDIIFAMDRSNQRDILAHAQNDEEHSKVRLILNELWPDKDMEVPDPYYDDNGFEQVYKMLNEACEEFVKMEDSRHKIECAYLQAEA